MRFNWLALVPIALGVAALSLGIQGGYGKLAHLLGLSGSPSSSSSASSSASPNTGNPSADAAVTGAAVAFSHLPTNARGALAAFSSVLDQTIFGLGGTPTH